MASYGIWYFGAPYSGGGGHIEQAGWRSTAQARRGVVRLGDLAMRERTVVVTDGRRILRHLTEHETALIGDVEYAQMHSDVEAA